MNRKQIASSSEVYHIKILVIKNSCILTSDTSFRLILKLMEKINK